MKKQILFFVVLMINMISVQLVSGQTATIDGSSCPSAPACPKYVCELSTINLVAGITSGTIDSVKWRERISLDGGTTWGGWSTVGTNLIQTVPSSGSSTLGQAYQSWLIVYQGGMARSAYAVTYVNANPIANLMCNDTTICAGITVTFTASAGGTNYNFKVNGGSIQSGASSTFASSMLINSDNVTVTITNGNGCTKTSLPITMIVYPVPTATITAGGPTTFCLGNNVVLTSSIADSYVWYLNGSIIPLPTSQSYTASVAGSYTVNITTGFCSATSSATVTTVNPLPVATVTPSIIQTVCSGGSVLLTANFIAGYTYQWQSSSDGGAIVPWGDVPGATSQTYTAIVTSAYRIKITNSNGCVNYSN